MGSLTDAGDVPEPGSSTRRCELQPFFSQKQFKCLL